MRANLIDFRISHPQMKNEAPPRLSLLFFLRSPSGCKSKNVLRVENISANCYVNSYFCDNNARPRIAGSQFFFQLSPSKTASHVMMKNNPQPSLSLFFFAFPLHPSPPFVSNRREERISRQFFTELLPSAANSR